MRFLLASLALLASTPSASAFVVPSSTKSTSMIATPTSLDASKCGKYDYDVIIVGCGVGGHGAALHSRSQELSTAIFSGNDVGGTCVNRGCVPSKALLAASGRVREMRAAEHLSEFGIKVEGEVTYDREGVARHARQLANRVKGNLEGSLVALGVDIVEGRGVLVGGNGNGGGEVHEVKDATSGKVYTAKVSKSLPMRSQVRIIPWNDGLGGGWDVLPFLVRAFTSTCPRFFSFRGRG
jgi:dihydrolipoamide dehydrogenase